MNPVFIYQNEAILDSNNKFTIDFIDDEIVNLVNFSSKNQYYISSLNCNITKANEKKISHSGTKALIDELSLLSRELIDKGSTFKNEISHVTTSLTQNFDIPRIAPQNYKLSIDPKIIEDNCYRYQFYDKTNKRIKHAKIFSPFSLFKKGIVFKGETDTTKNEKITFKLVENYTKIKCSFSQSNKDKWNIAVNLFRDINAKFVRERKSDGTYSWWALNPNLIWVAQIYANNNDNFIVNDFMKHTYWTLNYQSVFNGKYKIIGTPLAVVFNGDTQPFIQRQTNVEIRKNRPFLIPTTADLKRLNYGKSILDDCNYSGHYKLTDYDKKEINKLYPNFSFGSLGQYTSIGDKTKNTKWETADLITPPSIEYKKRADALNFDIRGEFMKIICSNRKYKDYLDSNNGVYFYDSYKDLPDDLDACKKLFDKDVLKIKKLVADIGEIKELTKDEQLNLTLYDNSNLIEETFIQRFNKQLQLYGFISIPFANTKKNHLITLKNLLPFRVKRDIQKENLTFELAYLEKEDQIPTNDKKIHNLSIVCIEKTKMPYVEKEITIEGLQSFDKYQKLNPLDIKITDAEIYKRLIFKENRRIKYRFIPNSILLSSSVQEDTEVIFLTVTGLNEARDIFINGKVYKAIGCIYTNEIEGWDKIKKSTSNWVNCKLSNSKYPFGAKHLAFEFDTTSLNTLLNFSLTLIDQKGKEIIFLTGEQKVPALNFTIQIIS